MVRSSVLICAVMRSISGSDVPGGPSSSMRKSVSLNSGTGDCRNCGTTTMPARAMSTTARKAGFGVRVARVSSPW